MATIHFRNAVVLFDGYDLSSSFKEITLEYMVEILDETAFGDDTRIHKGGLYDVRVSGKGNWEGGASAIEAVLFTRVGAGQEDKVLTLFANGVTEGTVTDMGYAMKCVIENFNFGNPVGSLLECDVVFQGRGIAA